MIRTYPGASRTRASLSVPRYHLVLMSCALSEQGSSIKDWPGFGVGSGLRLVGCWVRIRCFGFALFWLALLL